VRALALDTSTGCGSLALLHDATVIYESQLADDQRTARTFSVAIDGALRFVAWEPRTVGLVAVTNGPGSFTGLRISVTAARFFAYATHADLIALNTLDVIVEQLPCRDVLAQHVDRTAPRSCSVTARIPASSPLRTVAANCRATRTR